MLRTSRETARRRTGALAVVALALGGTAVAAAEVPNGCAASHPAAPTCTFTAEGDGVYVASGSWRISIKRGAGTVVYDSARHDDVGAPGVLRTGDVVTAEALTPGSTVVVSRAVSLGDASRVSCSAPAAAYGTGGAAVTRKGLPNDPLLDVQWGWAQIDSAGAWRQGARGARAVVAVVDTGVDTEHPDLRKRLVPGVDLWESRPGGSADCPGPDDEQYHGTVVAGVIAAEADNRIGIAGVAPAARLMPVRVRDDVNSTDFSRVAAGIVWAADHGADVISLTGGVTVPLRPNPLVAEQIAEAVAYAWSRGVVTVATAGNNSVPWCQYPASAEHVICAAATTSDGSPAQYSQFPVRGPGGIAVRAPGGARDGTCGSDVVSTAPPGSPLNPCGGGGYASDSGTTFAVAHTAGVAALLAGRGLSNEQIVECLRVTSSGRGAWDPVMGYGIVDAGAAVRECAAR